MLVTLLSLALLGLSAAQNYLSTEGKELRLNGEKVWLSGMNLAWQDDVEAMQKEIEFVEREGGNAVRIKLPRTDQIGDLFIDLSRVLARAQELDVVVIVVLWDGDAEDTTELKEVILDTEKLEQYTEVLAHMVKGLKHYQSLGMWEVISSPTSISPNGQKDQNDCLSTKDLGGTGSVDSEVYMWKMQRFINQVAATIHRQDKGALVTVGTNVAIPFQDRCLIAAGGLQEGTLDVHQVQIDTSKLPYEVKAEEHDTTKPVVISDFVYDCKDKKDVYAHYHWGYYEGYSGVFIRQNVCSCNQEMEVNGLFYLKGHRDFGNGGRVAFQFAPQKMVKSWGKRPKLLHNPDEMMEEEEARKKEEEEKRKAEEEEEERMRSEEL